MLRAIREVKPKWVLAENVRGIISTSKGLVFEKVLSDLEGEGYEVWPFLLPALSIDAPHRRDRVWFVANAISSGHLADKKRQKGQHSGQGRVSLNHIAGAGTKKFITDSIGELLQTFEETRKHYQQQQKEREIFTGLLQPDWRNFPIESPFCTGNDGVSERLDTTTISEKDWREMTIKMAGNAVVPGLVLKLYEIIDFLNNIQSR